MTKTATFNDKTGNTTFTTKSDFLEKCPEPSKHTAFELARDFHIMIYLHNENGPAYINKKKNIEEFWLDGRSITVENPEQAARMKAKLEFDDKFNTWLDEK